MYTTARNSYRPQTSPLVLYTAGTSDRTGGYVQHGGHGTSGVNNTQSTLPDRDYAYTTTNGGLTAASGNSIDAIGASSKEPVQNEDTHR